jgi:hypothetical protein
MSNTGGVQDSFERRPSIHSPESLSAIIRWPTPPVVDIEQRHFERISNSIFGPILALHYLGKLRFSVGADITAEWREWKCSLYSRLNFSAA